MTLVEPATALVGHIGVPGDKSISHRAALLGAIGEGETTIAGFGRSADTESTLAAVRALGAEVAEDEVDLVRVAGRGLRGLSAPDEPIDCGNSGTTLRLLARHPRRAGGPLRADRRRVAALAAGRAHRRAAHGRWAPRSRRRTGTRRSSSRAAGS